VTVSGRAAEGEGLGEGLAEGLGEGETLGEGEALGEGVAKPMLATAEPPPRATYRRAQPKIGPNEPCPCGSGKKYKKCCGAPNARPAAPPAE